MIVLRSNVNGEEQYFGLKEYELAVAIAKHWRHDGLRPSLYAKTYNGNFVFYNDLVYNRMAA